MTVPECPFCMKPITPHESVITLQCGWFMAKREVESARVVYHADCFRRVAEAGALTQPGSPVRDALSIFPSQRGLGL